MDGFGSISKVWDDAGDGHDDADDGHVDADDGHDDSDDAHASHVSLFQFWRAFSRATAKRTSVPIRARNSAFSGMLNISVRPHQPPKRLKNVFTRLFFLLY